MPTTDGLRFSRKASVAMLHRNYWKIINFWTPMPNAVRCQFAGGAGPGVSGMTCRASIFLS